MTPFDRSHAPTDLVTDNYLRAMQACGELRWEEAVRLFDQEPAASPCHGLALGNRGQALLALDRFVEAEDSLHRSLEVLGRLGCPHGPSEVQFRRNLGEAVGRQDRWGESFPLFADAVRRADELLRQCGEEREALLLQKAHALNSWGNSHLYLRSWQGAVECYEEVRAIYRELHPEVREGYAETLTNLALALMKREKLTRAETALKEALDVAAGDEDQVHRIKMASIQMGASLVKPEEREKTVVAAAEHAARAGRVPNSYLRYCIGAEAALDAGEAAESTRFIERARALEGGLAPHDLHVAMLRGTQARLLREGNTPDAGIVPVLIDGARRWYERLGKPAVGVDFASMTRSMHNHFRMLARHLVNLGRLEEALAAFEAGRSLLHYREMHPAFLNDTIRRNPFQDAPDRVAVDAVRAAQQTLGEGECAVVLAVLPPELIAFVVWRDRIELARCPWATTLAEGEAIWRDSEMIPHRLVAGAGERSVPALYHHFAESLIKVIGRTRVRGMTPYSILHLVPWRTLLRAHGVPWSQLAFSTGFGFLLRTAVTPALAVPGIAVSALGHGSAGGIDLKEEARRFAAEFGARGTFAAACKAADVLLALEAEQVVLLSCHGKAVKTEDSPATTFEFEAANGGTAVVGVEAMVPRAVKSPLVILSACESGVYDMEWGEFPTGVAPLLIQRGAHRCIGSRFLLRAAFAQKFFPALGHLLAAGQSVEEAFSEALARPWHGLRRTGTTCGEMLPASNCWAAGRSGPAARKGMLNGSLRLRALSAPRGGRCTALVEMCSTRQNPGTALLYHSRVGGHE